MSPPGWLHIEGEKTQYKSYYNKLKPGEEGQWPPRFWKFHLETDSNPPVKLAFTDARRLGRVRVVDCPGPDIRKHSPLVENGPDPVIDTDIFTEEFLRKIVKSRKVPIKALLLDQKAISGIGNWVADEVLFYARLHPEQYCDQFNDAQIGTLYKAIRYVCQTAVDKLGDPDEMPQDWIFHYRWGKGKNSAGKLPSGEKLAFVTVGGRTSCFAPALQKKTGAVAADADVKVEDDDAEKPAKKGRGKVKAEDEEVNGAPVSKAKGKTARARATVKKEDEDAESSPPGKKTQKRKGASVAGDAEDAPSPAPKKQRTTPASATIKAEAEAEADESGRRRSGRLRNKPIN